jgi:hypothetical protein
MLINQKVAFRSAVFSCHPDLGVTGHDPGDKTTEETKITYRVLARNPVGKCLLGRPR